MGRVEASQDVSGTFRLCAVVALPWVSCNGPIAAFLRPIQSEQLLPDLDFVALSISSQVGFVLTGAGIPGNNIRLLSAFHSFRHTAGRLVVSALGSRSRVANQGRPYLCEQGRQGGRWRPGARAYPAILGPRHRSVSRAPLLCVRACVWDCVRVGLCVDRSACGCVVLATLLFGWRARVDKCVTPHTHLPLFSLR